MSGPQCGRLTLVQSLASLLRNNGDSVLDGTSTLTLRAVSLQHLTRLFEQYLVTRTHQHGFLALPSHPADTVSLLQVQFLFDMLQKTISLKLINPPGTKLQSPVKIFPFKSLKYLELKRVPPQCLEGLRAVYSQLEAFTCSKSLHSVAELISLCGGDLSSALPWLELKTLNFSYNSITSLDNSLTLLNVLKSLNLSHNKIQDCAEFLLPLTELDHLNLGYNFLQTVPALSVSGRAKLVTLILKNNELETINGVEHLSSLQRLDLAYNLLMEHSQLAPLSQLHSLSVLNLEGNPLFFHPDHRVSTVRHISPKAAFLKLTLDGCLLSSSELAVLPKPGQLIGQAAQSSVPEVVLSERVIQEASSGGGELSDSLSLSETRAARLHRKKSKSKIKVRRASISEPSDTDHEPRAQYTSLAIVLRHQKEIERMDSFRDQLGEDWLRYKHHLEGMQAPEGSEVPVVRANAVKTSSHSDSNAGSQLLQVETHVGPVLTSEPKEEECGLDETESTLQWTVHSQEGTALDWSEHTLEVSPHDMQGEGAADAQKGVQVEEEEDDLEVDLCLPLVVGVLPGDESTKEAISRRFLRVKPGCVMEVDLHSGQVLARLELDILQEVITSQASWTEKGVEQSLPALELHFSYISRARQRRRYVMLDENPQQALQVLAEVLCRIAGENVQKVSEGRPRRVRLQCLKCKLEFQQQEDEDRGRLLSRRTGHMEEEEEEEGGRDTADSTAKALVCPECSSDHVVQISSQSDPCTSTPIPCPQGKHPSILHIPFGARHTGSQESPVSCSPRTGTPTANQELEGAEQTAQYDSTTESFSTPKNGTFYIGEGSGVEGQSWGDNTDSQLASFHTTDVDTPASTDVSFSSRLAVEINSKGEDLAGSYCYSTAKTPQTQPESNEESSLLEYNLFIEDFQAVDHRLKLFFDVDVFEEDSEELQLFLKMSTVKFGDPGEFPSLLVVSDQWLYILEITSETQGQPSDWLRKRESHQVSDLGYLEVGLGSQSIHMEFEEGGSAYTLLIRDSTRCEHVFSLLTEIVRKLAPKSDSKLKSISTIRLDPQHHLWPLIGENADMDGSEDYQLKFFYLLAFLLQGENMTPVTVLVTRDTLYLLNEDHQWSKSVPSQTSNGNTESFDRRVQVQETQPISCVSSVHLFSAAPRRVNIKLYDEIAKDEKTWQLQTDSPDLLTGLVDWIRTQWEAMFGVKLTTCLQETGS